MFSKTCWIDLNLLNLFACSLFNVFLASFSLVCVSTKRPRFASFAFWLSLFLHFYPLYSNFELYWFTALYWLTALYWFTGIVCTVSPPQAVVGRGAVVALLSFQRTNPEDALLHCVQQCAVTRVQMVHRKTQCVEGPMSENQSRGCALLQYIVILLDSRAAFFFKAPI